MDGQRIVTTTTAGLRPLGASGQRSHALLVDTLRRHLSQAHADLFAEPVPTPDGAQIDWYAAIEGPATPIEKADPAGRERAQAELGRLVADIERLAEQLERSPAAEDQQRAAALRHALRYPDDGYLWTVDGHPVVTAWAHVHEDARRPAASLRPGSGASRRAPGERPAAAPAPGMAPAPGAAATTTVISAPVLLGRGTPLALARAAAVAPAPAAAGGDRAEAAAGLRRRLSRPGGARGGRHPRSLPGRARRDAGSQRARARDAAPGRAGERDRPPAPRPRTARQRVPLACARASPRAIPARSGVPAGRGAGPERAGGEPSTSGSSARAARPAP